MSDDREGQSGPEYRPLHVQIRDLLVQRVAQKEWGPHEPLPSEILLADQYNVSVGTIRKALDDMVASHLILRRRGKGTFVQTHSPQKALFRWFSIFADDGTKTFPDDVVIGIESGEADEHEAALLDFTEPRRVIRVARRRVITRAPVMRDTITVPEHLFPGFSWPQANARYRTPYQYYELAFHVKVVEVEERLKAVLSDETDQWVLGVDLGSSMMLIERIAYSFDKKPVELRISRLITTNHFYRNIIR